MSINSLIDKQDSFEIVRDQIAAILAAEISSQMALATAASKDSDDWKLRIFVERAAPWEQFLNDQTDNSPLVNVWFDSSNIDLKASNLIQRQKTDGVFNIDCYGYGKSKSAVGGHTPGDKEAAFEVQKAIRLVRNILMSSEYTYLGLQGLVWNRYPLSINVFQPQIDSQNVQNIVAGRIALQVTFNEFSPQGDESELLEYVSINVKRTEDGQVLFEAGYDYT
jgi:hypothetical protein